MSSRSELIQRINNDKDAVSEVFGNILIIGIVMTGLMLLIVVGTSIIKDMQASAEYSGVEQAFTVTDSRLSKARFSTSIYQAAPIRVNDGTVYVNGTWDDSHITITDYNITSKTSTLIYEGTIGTIKCVTDKGVVAYQDGGVWLADDKNGSLMISPPDFDYNGVTLTLPITHIDGNETLAASGNTIVEITVNASNKSEIIYPKENKFGNPLPKNHSINVSIKTDYYEAWAKYVNERTRAVAVINPDKKLVNISLETGTGIREGPVIQGFDTEGLDQFYTAPVEKFDLHLVPMNPGNEYTITFGVEEPDKKKCTRPKPRDHG